MTNFLKLGYNMTLNSNLLMLIFARETKLVKVDNNKLVTIFFLPNCMTNFLKFLNTYFLIFLIFVKFDFFSLHAKIMSKRINSINLYRIVKSTALWHFIVLYFPAVPTKGCSQKCSFPKGIIN